MADIDPLGPEPEALAADSADKPAPPSGPAAPQRPRRSLLRELPVLIIVALVIAMLIKTFVVQAFVIPTGSMQNTLALQDKVLVNKLVYHVRSIHPGDIVVFDGSGSWNAPVPASSTSADPLARAYDDTLRKLFDSIGGLFGTPIGQTDYVKRVIGVPGDHVVCCNAQRPDHGQRRAAARAVLPVSGRPAGQRPDRHPGPVQCHGPGRVPVGARRPPEHLRRFARATKPTRATA